MKPSELDESYRATVERMLDSATGQLLAATGLTTSQLTALAILACEHRALMAFVIDMECSAKRARERVVELEARVVALERDKMARSEWDPR